MNIEQERAEFAAWVAADTLNSPHPTCISSLAYMSQLDRERGREYVPLYAAETVDALQAENERLRADVERLRTDGASAVRWAPSSAHWSTVLRELFGPNARDGIDATEARLREERERADRLAEACERLAQKWERQADEHGVRQFTGNDHRLFANELRVALIDASIKETNND